MRFFNFSLIKHEIANSMFLSCVSNIRLFAWFYTDYDSMRSAPSKPPQPVDTLSAKWLKHSSKTDPFRSRKERSYYVLRRATTRINDPPRSHTLSQPHILHLLPTAFQAKPASTTARFLAYAALLLNSRMLIFITQPARRQVDGPFPLRFSRSGAALSIPHNNSNFPSVTCWILPSP